MKVVNKKARFKYEILEKIEAGIMLTGAEIKSIRSGRANLSESFARIKNGEVFLVNAYIHPWIGQEKLADPRRERKLLLHKKQVLNWQGKISGAKLTLVPLSVYIKKNLAKVEIALAKNKSKYDKRAVLKKRVIERDINRALRGEKE